LGVWGGANNSSPTGLLRNVIQDLRIGRILWDDLGNRKCIYSSSSGQGQVVGFCEHGNESSGSIKGEEFLDQLIEY